MGKYKSSFATEQVRRFLLQKILRGGPQPARLPTERELTELLGFSRVTVRRAIDELEFGSYILRRPGKQGIYTNPAMAEIATSSIGLLRTSNHVSNREMTILGSMGEELMRQKFFYSLNFFMLYDASVEALVRNISHCGFDCVLAFEGSALVDALLARQIPVLAVDNLCTPAQEYAPGRFGIDWELAGRTAGAIVGRRNFKNILYCGEPSLLLESFRAAVPAAVPITVLPDREVESRLGFMLKDHEFDGAAVMLREVGMRKFFDVLAAIKPAKPPEIFLYPWFEADLFRQGNPEYPITVFNTDFFRDELRRLGRGLADNVIRLFHGQSAAPLRINPVAEPKKQL